MTSERESTIRRNGFPINRDDAKNLLAFINLTNPQHDLIEAEIVVKLEILSGKMMICLFPCRKSSITEGTEGPEKA